MAKKSVQARVDAVTKKLRERLQISKRAPADTKQPWIDEATNPPTIRTYVQGWYSARELRELADKIDSGAR